MNGITIETIAEKIKKSFWYLKVHVDLEKDGTGTIDFFRRKSNYYDLRFEITNLKEENMIIIKVKGEQFYIRFKRFFLRKLFFYIEKLVAFNSSKLIYVGTDSEKTRKILIGHLPSSYQNIEKLSYNYKWRKIISTRTSSDYFINNITPGFSELFVHINEEFEMFFEKISKEYPTFDYSYEEQYIGMPFSTLFSLSSFSFYIDGWKENCSFSFEENGYSFVSDSFGTFSASTTEEIKDHIRSLIEKMQTKQRVKTLFEEPKRYYRPFIERYFQDEEIQERIYRILRSKYKPNEIEAMVRHAHIHDFVHYCNVTYFKLNEDYFVLQDKNIWIFSSTEKEEAVAKLKSLAFQQMKETFEQSWNIQTELIEKLG